MMTKKKRYNKNHMPKEKITLPALTRTLNINLVNLAFCYNLKKQIATDFTSLNWFEVLQKSMKENKNDLVEYNNDSLNSHKGKISSNTSTETKAPTILLENSIVKNM